MAISQGHRLRSFDKRSLLEAHPFFHALGDEIIENLLPYALMRQVKKGTVIFRKGDGGTKLFAVSAGAVRISGPSEQGKEAVFNLIMPGDIFGEIAFLDGGERTADAVAIESSELMIIERRDFIPLIRAHPEIAARLIAILCRRLRKTTIQVEDIVFHSVQIRLAKALLYLYRRNPPEADIRITQRDLSQMIGASRETTNRELQLWQKRKWLKLKRAGLSILKANELERLVEQGSR